jgi:hypothetical protein
MLLFLQRAWALLPRLIGHALLGALLAASLFGALDANAAILSTIQESIITVKEKEINCGGDRVHAALAVRDQAGNVVTQTSAGTQVLIEGTLDLDCNNSPGDPPVVLFEVRDEDGMTVHLAWQTVSVESGKQIVTGLSWIPEKPGVYDVRFFALFCLNCTGQMPTIVTEEITVV